ncbi:MAG: histidinol dehydrogenase [Crenarchaeota archaeon]|nr:histidinol dehydrogenase [Thermoproteota archaeon]
MRISLSEVHKIRRGIEIEDAVEKIRDIVRDVKERGDKAILEHTEKIDKIKLESIKVSNEVISELASKVSSDVRESIEIVINRVREFNKKLIPKNEIIVLGSTIFKVKNIAIDRVGVYVPKGYISTMIMLCTIARVAGCREIIVFTPPSEKYPISPEMALVARLLKIREIYVGNGVTGIAAMAYGTETIRKVDKIFGPGNIYIQAAKYLVSTVVDIDGIEGPTELVLYVDESADSRDVRCAVLDALAELEHGTHSICLVISPSENILEIFEKEYENYRKDRILGPLYTIRVNNIDEAVRIIDEVAPEHLEIISRKDGLKIVEKVHNVGVVSFNAPCAYLDYVAGPCHVLPTSGFARSRGTMTPVDFMKRIVICENYDRELLRHGIKLAEIENMVLHGESLRCREHE